MLSFILIMLIIYTFVLLKKMSKKNLKSIYLREIPSNDTPAFVGKIIKGHTDGNDIIATILDLSYKNYIRIENEEINFKEKKVLILDKDISTINLQEHEIFLLNQIFKENNKVVFDSYLKSRQFKHNFQAFDKMLERSFENKTVRKNSVIKNISKIFLLVACFIFGIDILYSIILPLIILLKNIISFGFDTVIVSIVVSSIFNIFILHKYIKFIQKSTNVRENIIFSITYIILNVIWSYTLIFFNYTNILTMFYQEFVWYKILFNFILSIVTVLYMFNIIKHTQKEQYLYYTFIIISLFAIILKLNIAIGISILFYSVYIFFKVPKSNNFIQEDYIEKWIAFKKYIEDYSMLANQEENAVLLWQKYLIYAIALGVNKKVIKKYTHLNHIKLLSGTYWKSVYVEYLDE